MSDWSPYGLERYRTARMSRRTVWLLLGLLVAALLWGLVAYSAQKGSFQVGTDGGTNGQVSLGAAPDTRPKPVSIAITPGRVQLLGAPIDTGNAPAAQTQPASIEPPYPMLGWALLFGPFLLIPFVLRRLFARQATELNFGVYKGAMPLEMISSTHRDLLYSRKQVATPLFGKSRDDYVGGGPP